MESATETTATFKEEPDENLSNDDPTEAPDSPPKIDSTQPFIPRQPPAKRKRERAKLWQSKNFPQVVISAPPPAPTISPPPPVYV